MKDLKICSPQLGLNPDSDLGGEVHDHFILQGIANLGYKVFVYLPKERLYQKNPNIIVSRAPFKHILAITFNLLIIPYLFKTFHEEKFNLLRVHNPYFVGLAAIIFKFLNPKIPIIATHHLIPTNFLSNLVNVISASKYDAIITVSNYLKKNLIKKYNINQDKIYVIHNGVSEKYKFKEKNQKLVKKYNLEKKIVLLFMGLLIPRKNPTFLLDLFQNVKSTNKNISLIICGNGPLGPKMKKFVKKNKIQDVIFTGVIIGRNKIDHLNLCDIFVHPSVDEGLPLSPLEAMACRKPIIINDAYSAREIVENGLNGFTCKMNDKKDWQDKIVRLITSSSLRQKMGMRSEKLIKQKFLWKNSVNGHIKLYQSLITN